jgi:hypothetical protein
MVAASEVTLAAPSRICTRCQEIFPATREHFYPNKQGVYGLASRCKSCANIATHESRKKHDPTFQRVYRWREQNPGAHAKASRRYRTNWTEERRERHREWLRHWRAVQSIDGRWRLIAAMRTQIGLILRKRIAGDGPRGLLRRLGYSRAALIRHLEAQFESGMTWANYGRGGWEVDHIQPVSRFDHSDPEQFRACWAFENLQPMWGTANRAKGARMPMV